MKPSSSAVLALLVVFARGVIAQPQAPNDSSSSPASTGNKVIKGAPFSADTITLPDEVLTNGEHERHELHGRVWRDSQGRTCLDIGNPRTTHSTVTMSAATTSIERPRNLSACSHRVGGRENLPEEERRWSELFCSMSYSIEL